MCKSILHSVMVQTISSSVQIMQSSDISKVKFVLVIFCILALVTVWQCMKTANSYYRKTP